MRYGRYLLLALFLVVLLSSPVLVNHVLAQTEQIPSWVKTLFTYYAQGQISDAELLAAIEYLIEQGVISVPDQTEEYEDRGDFYVTYGPNPNSAYSGADKADAWLKNAGLLEYEVGWLNDNFRLPYDVEIIAQECGEVNAFYYPDNKQVVMCYELVDDLFETYYYFYEDTQDFDAGYVGSYAYDVVDFIFWHEIGHAFIDIYDLPVTGLEENVADQFAALILSYTSDDETGSFDTGQEMLDSVGLWFALENEYWTVTYPALYPEEEIDTPYWGQHGLSVQRFYNVACYSYGADPGHNLFLIADGVLPADRAVTCEDEYWHIDDTWRTLLGNFDYGFFDP